MTNSERLHMKMRYLVAERALEDRSWMRHPDLLSTLSETEIIPRLNIVPIPAHEVWEETLFFAVTDPTYKPGAASFVVAVTADGTAYRIDSVDTFQQLVLVSDPKVGSVDEALQIAEQYVLTLGTKYPQYGERVRILASCEEIPLRPGEALPEEICSMIEPASVEDRDDRFVIRLFAWTELGGELKQFEFQLSKKGEIVVGETLLGEGLGRAWLPK